MTTDLIRGDNGEEAAAFLAMRVRLGMPIHPARRIDPARLGRVPPPKPDPVVLSWLAPLNMLLPPSWRAIVKLVALKHGIPVRKILGMGRQPAVAAARQEAMFLLYTHCEPNFALIGRLFGDRDHTTSRHLVLKEARARGRDAACSAYRPSKHPEVSRC